MNDETLALTFGWTMHNDINVIGSKWFQEQVRQHFVRLLQFFPEFYSLETAEESLFRLDWYISVELSRIHQLRAVC